ncbi:hypothetical protein V7S43_012917 [Phytophthora oleae]|uniref:Uncharacterized protein n=1 Tax=Phytophthora oleae TaxID=2107226 RepID=A0ABD3F6Y8_9STRA
MLSCYFVYGSSQRDNKLLRLHKACRLFMKVPTQCVVYGSSFPIACYILAHILDSPFTYNVLESHFFSQGGSLYIEPRAFIAYAVVQMRSVWIYALIWHFIVHLSALRGLLRSNQVHSGIYGVPEFLLSTFASVTLIAQYRSTSFRSSKIENIFQLPSNSGLGWVAAKHQYNSSRLGSGRLLLGGVIIDLKFLILLTFAIVTMWIMHLSWAKYWSWKHGERRYRHWAVFPPTPVPYSAGILWPTISASVQWSSDYYCIRDERYERDLYY